VRCLHINTWTCARQLCLRSARASPRQARTARQRLTKGGRLCHMPQRARRRAHGTRGEQRAGAGADARSAGSRARPSCVAAAAVGRQRGLHRLHALQPRARPRLAQVGPARAQHAPVAQPCGVRPGRASAQTGPAGALCRVDGQATGAAPRAEQAPKAVCLSLPPGTCPKGRPAEAHRSPRRPSPTRPTHRRRNTPAGRPRARAITAAQPHERPQRRLPASQPDPGGAATPATPGDRRAGVEQPVRAPGACTREDRRGRRRRRAAHPR